MAAHPLITGIGSLPHHNIDAALEYSFAHTLPFLPQIPLANPWEFMLTQALDGLPGLIADKEGGVTLDTDVWAGRRRAFDDKLLNAFSIMTKPDAFESFEPSSSTASCWHPFLWELEERKISQAKVQIAGPLTAQMALRSKQGTSPWKIPELSSQVYRLILARALAITRRLQSIQVQPVLYLDEPAFYAMDYTNPAHQMIFNELKLLISALQKENVLVGVHCCSNTDWQRVFDLRANFISMDCHLSLEALLVADQKSECKSKLSFGIIPTGSVRSVNGAHLAKDLKQKLSQFHREKFLEGAILTAACGLAFQTPEAAEEVLALLRSAIKEI